MEYYITSDRNRNVYLYEKEWFEANYEPVNKKCLTTCKNCRNTFETELTHPFCTTQICPVCEHQLHQSGNMVKTSGADLDKGMM
jgi:hypothetical protein